MDARIQALFGLKYNPFSPDVPTDGLVRTARIDAFCHRVESLVLDGGIALVTGEPGAGKSVVLRLLAERLGKMRELTVATISRPQSGMTDFYRELSLTFGLACGTSNRWGGFRSLREKWLSHIETTLLRPIILIDEAQEVPTPVLSEIRLLSSIAYDSKAILTVILAGDLRLPERLRDSALTPLESRLRTRLRLEPASRDEMVTMLETRCEAAGNASLVTSELAATLAERSLGNARAMLNIADELLTAAAARDLKQLDEKLYLDLYPTPDPRQQRKTALRRA